MVKFAMYGFDVNDMNVVGYLKSVGSNYILTDDIHEAMLFEVKSRRKNSKRKTGTPEQWLEFFNTDPDNPYKFHLVKTCL